MTLNDAIETILDFYYVQVKGDSVVAHATDILPTTVEVWAAWTVLAKQTGRIPQQGVKTMTDFNDWYAQQNPDLDPRLDDFHQEARKAYEAGAASQDRTLRDEFAMAASSCADHSWCMTPVQRASNAYYIADAMLKARKTTGEGEA
jgi:hypothetical protein